MIIYEIWLLSPTRNQRCASRQVLRMQVAHHAMGIVHNELIGAAFLLAVAGLCVLSPPSSFDVLPAALCLIVFVFATRVRFDTPFGFTVATQLAFVPLLFALPVALVPLAVAVGLASLAEAVLRGQPVEDAAIAREIAPCFVDRDGKRTDVVVLACTHYPLVLEAMKRVAPWPVTWLDPAPAIARRAADLAGSIPARTVVEDGLAVFTGGAGLTDDLKAVLAARGLPAIAVEAMPPRWH